MSGRKNKTKITTALTPDEQVQRYLLRMFHSIDEVMWVRSAENMDLVYASLALTGLLGLQADQIGTDEGMQVWMSRIHPADLDDVKRMQAHVQQGESGEICYRYNHPTQGRRWIRERLFPIRDEDGKLMGLGGMSLDVTAQKENERQVRLLSAIVQQMKDVVVIADTEHRIQYVNPAFQEVYGYTPEEALGQSTQIMWAGSDEAWEELAQQNQTHVEQNGIARSEFQDRRKDGSLLWVANTCSLLHLNEGEDYWMCINHVIDAQKQIQNELHSANQKLVKWVAELEVRTRTSTLLSEMGDMLQSCLSVDEVAMVARQYMPQFNLGHSGGLYLARGTDDMLDLAVAWGDRARLETQFQTRDCWALRRGRQHVLDHHEMHLECPHVSRVKPIPPQATLCLPLNARNELLGLLHVVLGDAMPIPEASQLGDIMADRLSLILSNIRLSEKLMRQSTHDVLTGLHNVVYLEELLEKEVRLAGLDRRNLGLMMVDLKDFESYNQRNSYYGGDQLISEFGHLLQDCFGDSLAIARYRGDIFILLLTHDQLGDVYRRMDQLREAAARLPQTLNHRIEGTLELSAGMAVYPHHGSNARQMLVAAESALAQAKHESSGRLVVLPVE